MPIGDSITFGYNTADTQGAEGGYRYPLSILLAGSLQSPIHFSGSQSNGPSIWAEKSHEGHPGWRIDEILAGVRTQGWLETYRPNLVIVMAGTNDIGQNYDLPNSGTRLNLLLDEIYGRLPNVKVVLASVPPIGGADLDVNQLNSAIRSIYSTRAAQGYRISFADVHGGLTLNDLSDGVHPTKDGYNKIATVLSLGILDAVKNF
jgi:hypothetical protein